MIEASAGLRAAIDAPVRWIKAIAEVYFDGNGQPPAVFTQETIESFSLLEEIGDEMGKLGSITSNELSISFFNESGLFNPRNVTSPYYNKLLPNVKIVLSLEVAPDVINEQITEVIPMGTFYAYTWDAASDKMDCSVVGGDSLFKIMNRDCPSIAVMEDTNINELLHKLFTELGLAPTDYYVDPKIDVPVPFGWFKKGKVKDTLTSFAAAGMCTISTDRYNIIRAESNLTIKATGTTLGEDNQIIAGSMPQKYHDVFTAINVAYALPSLEKEQELLDIKSLVIPRGIFTFRGLQFSDGPVYYPSEIVLRGVSNVDIVDITHNTWGIDLILNNKLDKEQIANLVIKGTVVKLQEVEISVEDTQSVAQIGLKAYDVNVNDFVQYEVLAKEIAIRLLNRHILPSPKINASARGNPLLQPNDLAIVDLPADQIDLIRAIITRAEYTYSGGLEAQYEFMVEEARIMHDKVFIAPGFMIYVPRILNL